MMPRHTHIHSHHSDFKLLKTSMPTNSQYSLLFSSLNRIHHITSAHCRMTSSIHMIAFPSPFSLSARSNLIQSSSPLQVSLPLHRVRLKAIPLPGTVHCKPNVRTREHETKEDELQEEPSPAATLFGSMRLRLRLGALITGRRVRRPRWVLLVQVERLDGDDVVVVGELARFGGKA